MTHPAHAVLGDGKRERIENKELAFEYGQRLNRHDVLGATWAKSGNRRRHSRRGFGVLQKPIPGTAGGEYWNPSGVRRVLLQISEAAMNSRGNALFPAIRRFPTEPECAPGPADGCDGPPHLTTTANRPRATIRADTTKFQQPASGHPEAGSTRIAPPSRCNIHQDV